MLTFFSFKDPSLPSLMRDLDRSSFQESARKVQPPTAGPTTTWTQQVCKMMAFIATFCGSGLFIFTYFWGLGSLIKMKFLDQAQGFGCRECSHLRMSRLGLPNPEP